MTLRQQLEAIAEVHADEPMARHTTFGIGGPTDFYAIATTGAQLRDLTRTARAATVPVFVLGSGSNLVVGDGGIRGVVIENRATTVAEARIVGSEIRLDAESGASLAKLARTTADQSLTGLEWAAGIPGSLGGAVVYNAGAYGGCLADVLTRIDVLDPDGRETTIFAEELGLAYRSSAFTRGLLVERVILGVEFRLEEGNRDAARARIEQLEAKRKRTQPRGRNAGSIFKNPSSHPAWWLIDKVGLRGHRIGDAVISEKHTNWIINQGSARATEVHALMRLAGERVRDTFGIELHAEIALVGEGFA
ncbi:MAG: UDP-N-acetylmuramate dehydrogenase [Chloroflexi bacterium]|nr:UDP-N-acetylmuramate dehydrogenase [Chloroflexota bacterium]